MSFGGVLRLIMMTPQQPGGHKLPGALVTGDR